MTILAGVLKAPRSRKSMFNVAAESDGANHVTITTSVTLKKRISATGDDRIACFQLIANFESYFLNLWLIGGQPLNLDLSLD